MTGPLGPLPLIEADEATLVALLPGELTPAQDRQGRVSRDGGGLRVTCPDAVLLFDLRSERALRAAPRLVLVEAEGEQARPLGELTLTWDL
jgi:hypothetical protein